MSEPSSDIRKAAILVRSLGAETTAFLLGQLSPAERETIRGAVRSLGTVTDGERTRVVAEFQRLATGVGTGALSASVAQPAADSLHDLPPQETADAVLAELVCLDASKVRTLLETVDRDLLVLALADCDEFLVRHVAGQLARREAKTFRRQLGELGPTRLRDVEAAKRAVAGVVLRLRGRSIPGTRALAA